MVELDAQELAAVVAIAAVAGSSVYYLGRLRSELEHVRRELERLARRADATDRALLEFRVEVSAIAAPRERAMLPRDEFREDA